MAHGQGKHWVLVKGHKIGVRGKPEPDLDCVGFFFVFFLIGVLMGEARYSRVSSLGLACWNNSGRLYHRGISSFPWWLRW